VMAYLPEDVHAIQFFGFEKLAVLVSRGRLLHQRHLGLPTTED
jgi:hypothetical protein